ncbi:NADH-quinone oxidoreductase subunit H, partial [bacterium]|nr:NADH-quinone oxidoreductase subunit H [bacterium]
GLFRKITARSQWRYGPPLLQPFIDIIRMFSQDGFSHGFIFDFGLCLSIAGSILAIFFTPLGGFCVIRSSSGLLILLYILLLAPLGMALSGGAAANPNSSIGISRKLMMSFAYEIPFTIIIVSLMSYYKSISIINIVNAQANFHWALFSPLAFSGIAYFLILNAMLGLRPFDIASAPQEISSGELVEYSGKYFGLHQIDHALHLFLYIALIVNLFLGGGNIIFFLVKMFFVFIIGTCIHIAFPRVRTEQALKYLLTWPVLISLLSIILILIIK